MPSPLPRWDRRWDRVAPLKPATAAFPIPLLGRLPHYLFRGLLGVHSRYGLPARGTAKRSFPSEASAVSLPPLPLRLLPAGATVAGWELHPLKIGALARRTKGSGTGPGLPEHSGFASSGPVPVPFLSTRPDDSQKERALP